MTILILKRHGLDEMEPIARWKDGEWTDGDPDKYRFIRDDSYQQYDARMMLSEFDGPDIFAIPEDDYEADVAIGEPNESIYSRILESLQASPETVHTSAGFDERFGEGGIDASWDLITYGALCLLAERGAGTRIQVNATPQEEHPTVWKAYVADGYDRRRAMRLFQSQEPAFEYLLRFADREEFEAVSGLCGVWKAELWEGTAVLRREAVLEENPLG